MTNLQRIKAVAKELNLTFKRNGSRINGALLYDFVSSSGYVVGKNWTISSAANELYNGDLRSILSD